MTGSCCFKGNRHERFLATAYKEVVQSQFDIARLIRRVNILQGLARSQITDLEWQRARKKYGLYTMEHWFNSLLARQQ